MLSCQNVCHGWKGPDGALPVIVQEIKCLWSSSEWQQFHCMAVILLTVVAVLKDRSCQVSSALGASTRGYCHPKNLLQ